MLYMIVGAVIVYIISIVFMYRKGLSDGYAQFAEDIDDFNNSLSQVQRNEFTLWMDSFEKFLNN